MMEQSSHIQKSTFDESDLKGESFYYICLRWWRQFLALNGKNIIMFLRRPFLLVLALILPSAAMFIFFVGWSNAANSNSSNSQTIVTQQTPSVLQGLGPCDAYSAGSTCLQVAFSPAMPYFESVMRRVANNNNLEYGSEVLGFANDDELKNYVAANLGQVQFSVFFLNDFIWYKTSLLAQVPKGTKSYVIYYNGTQGSQDSRSKYHNVNFPLLVLQKTIEEALLVEYNSAHGISTNVTYDCDFAQTWAFIPSSTSGTSTTDDDNVLTNTTVCGPPIERDMLPLNQAGSFLFTYIYQFLGILAFQIIADERHKGLFQSLKTLGLNASAYWLSWFFIFQIFIFTASALALVIAAIIRPFTFALAHLDFGVLFLLLWLGETCSVSNAFFLASFIPKGNIASAVIVSNFFLAFLTLYLCIFTLNSYEELSYMDSDSNTVTKCLLHGSSYNFIYSNEPAMGLVRFVVFWMPWWHMGIILSNILSVIQYGQDFTWQDVYDQPSLYYVTLIGQNLKTYVPESVSWSFGMMVLLTLTYLLLSWILIQRAEGSAWSSILVPRSVYNFLFGVDNPVLVTDYRGLERQQSREEGSIRAYKVSKTYKTVQALKEVSFQINKGEVFCLLGHNGAGKSTLFNILSGVTTTSHGNVYIAGYDVNRDSMMIQQMIGICPQQDFLWDELTAMEHMRLFAQFKGIRLGPKLDAACEDVLSLVGLYGRRHTLAKSFSGGMKRRLSASMSIVGQVKVLYLDEPTTGLDPLSRRAIWDMIAIMKKDRVVVLTTHNMEEADYLSDRIMILQQGQVKALGDSLFLKQNYGTGYQVRMIVEPSVASVVSNEVMKILSKSSIEGDVSAGNIIVRINKLDYYYFGRFLAWLELVQLAGNDVIKGWSISNTTLEQVFLILCESAVINYQATNEPNILRSEICPFCEKNAKASLTFIPYKAKSQLMLPNSVCENCSAIECFVISDEQYNDLLKSESPQYKDAVLSEMLKSAQDKRSKQFQAVTSSAEAFMGDFSKAIANHLETNVEVTTDINLKLDHKGSQFTEVTGDNNINHASLLEVPLIAKEGSKVRIGSLFSAAIALGIKNTRLQSYQRYSTCCVFLFLGGLLCMLFVFGFLYATTVVCPQGYTLSDGKDSSTPTNYPTDCSLVLLSDYLFTFTNYGSMYLYGKLANYNYSIDAYLFPGGRQYSYYTVKSNQVQYGTVYAFTGLPYYPTRWGTIWAQNVASSIQNYEYYYTLYYPKKYSGVSWNQEMFATQLQVYNQTKQFPTGSCRSKFASSVNSTTRGTGYFYYYLDTGNLFADAAFDCPTCSPNSSNYFNGTIWVANGQGKDPYPYLFGNSRPIYNTKPYWPLSWQCPNASVYEMFTSVSDLNSAYSSNYTTHYFNSNTLLSMQFLNMLTNSILNASFSTYAIQGGVSTYSTVNFDYTTNKSLLFVLSMVGTLILNAFFPMMVWRLSYERTTGLRLMMNSVGLKNSAYVFGMFLYDFVIMLTINWVIFILCVEVRLSLFDEAPVQYLLLLGLISAYSICGFSFAFVRLFAINSRLTAVVATLLMLAGSLLACFVCLLIYPEVSNQSWPNGLAIIPFFAQVRVIWVLLSIQKTNYESSVALGLLFAFGTICFAFEILSNSTFGELWYNLRICCPQVMSSDDEMLLYSPLPHVATAIIEDESPQLDDDVVNEQQKIDKLSIEDISTQYAIVIRHLKQEFALDGKSFVAVNNLSLALNYGEVFGLLGPNGAGKSTTISILTGILRPTSGEVFVAGENILTVKGLGFHNLIGICQQSDIFWEQLSVFEHLCFQARLRGVPVTAINAEVQRVSVKIGLDGDAYLSPAGTLSGGQKRRLSIGMAIVADPPIIVMDEPSAGLDPSTRQGLWRLISSLRHPKRLILLTTHSMEEAETLCTRLAVLSEGQLKCLGSSVHLKAKFGTGYTMEVNVATQPQPRSVSASSPARRHYVEISSQEEKGELRSTEITDVPSNHPVDQFMLSQVAQKRGGQLISAINLTRKYMIPKQGIKISEIFTTMELNKKELHIQEWSIAETTLEDIFISLVTK